MGDLAIPAPLPAFRQLARPCATLGCPNVLSAADRDGRCTACHDEAARAEMARPVYKVCKLCGDPVYRHGRCRFHYDEYHRTYRELHKPPPKPREPKPVKLPVVSYGRPRVTTCSKPGCNAPKAPSRSRCPEHDREQKRLALAARQAHPGKTNAHSS